MPAGIPITRREHSAEQLRRAAARSKDGNAARRLLALAHVMDGMPRGEAAVACGMTGQTLRDWVHRYNAEGLPGLYDRPSPGPKPRLSPAQEAQVKQWVLQGPNLAQHGVVRWRRIDLGREIQKQFGVTLAERSVGTMLRRLGLRRLSVRPQHPRKDLAAQETFKKTLPTW